MIVDLTKTTVATIQLSQNLEEVARRCAGALAEVIRSGSRDSSPILRDPSLRRGRRPNVVYFKSSTHADRRPEVVSRHHRQGKRDESCKSIFAKMSVAVHHRQSVPALQESLKELAGLVRSIHALRHETQRELQAAVLVKHCALKEQGRNKKLSNEAKHDLRKRFWKSIDSCENEESALRKSLDVIKNIRLASSARSGFLSGLGRAQRGEVVRKSALMMNLKNLARQLPLWVPTDHEKPPPLCGATPAPPGYEAEPHSMVAAFVKNDDDEEWILARVRHYDRTSGRYQVDDIDDEHPETLTLSRKNIIPLPLMRANPITNPEAFFPKGTVVNALYPQTTCFYRGLVDEIPLGPQEGYSVQFEDENYPGGFAPALVVEQLYVIECVL